MGFRPFVYNLAQKLGLAGYVLNSSSGVMIELEGPKRAVDQFLTALANDPPPLAQIDEVVTNDLQLQGDGEFTIRSSQQEQSEFVLVSPDMATCSDCWAEFTDPRNRRFGYPFTNCTNCGPRYTIVQDIPYDRPKTTMASFAMCELCQAEYEDPANRRFHAQPNACAVCGPSLALRQSGPSGFSGSIEFQNRESSAAVIREARKLLTQGKILAIRGLGGFLLACDAESDAAVQTLRQRKRRSEKPFAVMARDIAAVEAFCVVSAADREALLNRRRPIVILPRRPEAALSREIGPGTETVGVMLPYTPLHYLLFGNSPAGDGEYAALVMTSGNMSEEPIVTANQEAWERLGHVADWFLFHNRDIYMRVDDSVVRTFEGRERVLRRARGYVPYPVDLRVPVEEVLGCGGELKNTFCLTKSHWAILSQHIGDMENYETLMFFEQTLANLQKLFRVTPRAVAHDLHPGYMSTRFAQQLPMERKFPVQHHHAHIASCMAENHLQGTVIGVAFDGTGYGTDGKIWGGEFLTAGYEGFTRRAHFRYIALPGGDAAVRQPWRAGLSYLRDTYGGGPLPGHLALFREVPEKQLSPVETMIVRDFQCLPTSSCGRLFDAVASIAGLKQEVTFEGQAAIALEAAALEGVEQRYGFDLHASQHASGAEEVDMRPAIQEIVADLVNSVPAGVLSARFHNTVAAAVIEVCEGIRRNQGLDRVCLSGGSFQNMYLLKRAAEGLRSRGFEVYLHAMVPPNDGGLALGQAVIANALMRRGD